MPIQECTALKSQLFLLFALPLKFFVFAKISFRQKPVQKPVPKLVLKERSFETKDEKSLASGGKGREENFLLLPRTLWKVFSSPKNT